MSPTVDTVAIKKAVEILDQGGLVAIPTETVYGLAANADDESAVLATFKAKGRPTDHPLIVHVASAEALPFWAKEIPQAALILVKRFWPGPLTIVLKKKDRCGLFVTGGQDSVALRCPSHPWTQALLKAFEGPTHRGLTAPSANAFGRISPSCAQHVLDDLGLKPTGKLEMVLDGGECEFGLESTMINLSGEHPSLLRHGVISRAMLEEALGVSVPDAGSDAPRASGRLKSHYAPKTKLELVDAEGFEKRLNELKDEKVAILASTTTLSKTPEHVVLYLKSHDDVKHYGATLYENLHRLDGVNATRILIERPSQDSAWAAVNDRLNRAAA